MKMQRFAEGNTNKDHIKNEDIWMEQITTFIRQRRLRWYGKVLRKERGCHQEDVKYAGAGEEKKVEAQEKKAR